MKDERLVSKMEGKTNFSSHLKQFDGLVRLTATFWFYDWSTLLAISNVSFKKLYDIYEILDPEIFYAAKMTFTAIQVISTVQGH